MKGEVTNQVFPTEGAVPKFERASSGNRKSEIEDTLEQVAKEYPVGVPVNIRQYAKKESASGTLYNLRHREHVSGTWQFDIGPMDSFGEEFAGQTGLWATRVA